MPQNIRPALVTLALLAGGAARAEQADRTQPISVSATVATADNKQRTAAFDGNVVLTQGTLEIHADRMTLRTDARGERLGFAYGAPGAPVRFRQRGDRPGEWSEGQADRVEVDSLANEVRLIGDASLRNLSGTQVTQSVASPVIVYDTARDTVSSTAAQPAPINGAAPPGADAAPRVTIVFAPRLAPTPTPNP